MQLIIATHKLKTNIIIIIRVVGQGETVALEYMCTVYTTCIIHVHVHVHCVHPEIHIIHIHTYQHSHNLLMVHTHTYQHSTQLTHGTHTQTNTVTTYSWYTHTNQHSHNLLMVHTHKPTQSQLTHGTHIIHIHVYTNTVITYS